MIEKLSNCRRLVLKPGQQAADDWGPGVSTGFVDGESLGDVVAGTVCVAEDKVV